ncbi:hypothetical protein I4U23_022605 [Adineta vaga]|nr:hypothetical protein I4U23_022605 [Adineta vaga]
MIQISDKDLLITFGSGRDSYSNKIPFNINYTIPHLQYSILSETNLAFRLVNVIPNSAFTWHRGALDHTENDDGGYMFLVDDVHNTDRQLFRIIINNLCIKSNYEFSAYLTNVLSRNYAGIKPNIRFEVRTLSNESDLLAKSSTGDLPTYDKLTWSKHAVSFQASTSSVVLLIISSVSGANGNDFAIDDIELRMCSTPDLRFCHSNIYNLPILCDNATWNQHNTMSINLTMFNVRPGSLFIDYKNNLYIGDYTNQQITIWNPDQIDPIRILQVKMSTHTSIIVTDNGDIYYEHADIVGRIEKWSIQSNTSAFVAKFIGTCYGIFIDMANNLYCSVLFGRRVMKISLDTKLEIWRAGNGVSGSDSEKLYEPSDGGNHRIQYFPYNQTIAETIAGKGIPNGLQLDYSTDVILDFNNYIYITDNGNHRIIRIQNNQYRCIIGCTNESKLSENQLGWVYANRFDSYGNLYVIGERNDRIQKFELMNTGCDCLPPLIYLTPSRILWKYHRHQPILLTSSIELHYLIKSEDTIQSSLIISSRAFRINQTYEFLLQIIDRETQSNQYLNYLNVQIIENPLPKLTINCLVLIMCLIVNSFHYINPTRQLTLYSSCINNCSLHIHINWKIFQGIQYSNNQSAIQWNLFNHSNSLWFNGSTEENLTISKMFFRENNQIKYWQIQSISSSNLKEDFFIQINDQPQNGNCSISPLSGTIFTLFTIICNDWFDQDQIKDYSVYVKTNNSIEWQILSQTTNNQIEIRIGTSIHSNVFVSLMVQIRDTFDCSTDFVLPKVKIYGNQSLLMNLTLFDNILKDKDKYQAGQMMFSLIEILDEHIQLSILINKILFMKNSSNTLSMNDINRYANLREYMIKLVNLWSIETLTDLKFQTTILSKLTQTTNQLTRIASIIVSKRCLQSTKYLRNIFQQVSYEDIQYISKNLLQCTSNVLTAINGPLQKRMNILENDLIEFSKILNHCTLFNKCSLWIQLIINNDDDDEQTKHFNYQKEIAKTLLNENEEIIDLITLLLSRHLTFNEKIHFETTSIDFILEKVRSWSFENESQIIYRQVKL